MGISPPRPLREEDDVSALDCGQSSLNKWLQNHAWRNQQTGVSRTNVICDEDTGQIIGFVTLSSGAIERGSISRKDRQGKPNPIPLTLLGQLAIDQNYAGQRLGQSLLFFALKTAKAMSEKIGSFGILTHPLNETAREFYLHYGFENIPGDTHGAMLLRMKDIDASGF